MIIKPCPFCGTTPLFDDGAAFSYPDGDRKWGAVRCCCYGPEVLTLYSEWVEWRTDAVEAWNERAERDQLQADLSHAIELRPVLSANDRCELLETVASLGSTIRGLEGVKAELLETIRLSSEFVNRDEHDSECSSDDGCVCGLLALKELLAKHQEAKV